MSLNVARTLCTVIASANGGCAASAARCARNRPNASSRAVEASPNTCICSIWFCSLRVKSMMRDAPSSHHCTKRELNSTLDHVPDLYRPHETQRIGLAVGVDRCAASQRMHPSSCCAASDVLLCAALLCAASDVLSDVLLLLLLR